MNKIFRVIWNQSTQSWVAVSELAKGRVKSSTTSEINAEVNRSDKKWWVISTLSILSLLASTNSFAVQATGGNMSFQKTGSSTNDGLSISYGNASGIAKRLRLEEI